MTVAIYELEPHSTADVQAFERCYGLSTAVTNVTVDGGPGTGYGSGEAALDIEDVAALAPGAQHPRLPGPEQHTQRRRLRTARHDEPDRRRRPRPCRETSWGVCEATLTSTAAALENRIFQADGHPGPDDAGRVRRLRLRGLLVPGDIGRPEHKHDTRRRRPGQPARRHRRRRHRPADRWHRRPDRLERLPGRTVDNTALRQRSRRRRVRRRRLPALDDAGVAVGRRGDTAGRCVDRVLRLLPGGARRVGRRRARHRLRRLLPRWLGGARRDQRRARRCGPP